MIMKKLIKTLTVLCTAIPVAALSACTALTAVTDENKPTVYQEYAEKLANSLTAMATGDVYFNDYTSEMFTTKSGEDFSQFAMRIDCDAAFTDAAATRMSQKATMDLTATMNGEEMNGKADMRAYFTEDGIYQYVMEEATGAEKVEAKSFIPAAELAPEDLPTLQNSIHLPVGFDGSAEAFLSLYGGAEWLTAEDGTKLQIKSNATNDWGGSYFPAMISMLGGEGLSVEIEQTVTITFDKQGNLLFIEQEVVASATSTTTPPQAEEGNGNEEVSPANDEASNEENTENEGNEENGEQAGEDENTHTPQTVTSTGNYRYYRKISVKNGSTVKLPTAAELETYKKPVEVPEETPDEGEKQD